MNRASANYWISQLKMEQHIEGGWFKEVYRSPLILPGEMLPPGFHGPRHSSTHIYFLLNKTGFSAFHRIQSDELWHFYDGAPLIVYEIHQSGQLTQHLLGRNMDKGESLFCKICAGNWFASCVAPDGEFSLVGCTVSPGFDFAEFELAERSALAAQFPDMKELIERLTRP